MKLPRSYFNYVSYLGTIIAGIAWITIIFLFVLEFFFNTGSVYFELYTYLIVPGFLAGGLVLIAIGMHLQRRRIKKVGQQQAKQKLIINLNDPKTRNAALIFTTVTIFFVLFTVIGSYKGFHYTESVQFCGKLCHKVMNPEYVAYQNSPHARVKCAECHVGEGVGWYVKSKMSGLRQVIKYLSRTYPRPIETPISNLRPAKETCEECHWPQKFYPNLLVNKKHFLADEKSTEWDILLRMKIGSEHSSKGIQNGIHWHINKDVKIEYIASTEDREHIPWVRYINLATGDTTIFQDSLEPIPNEKLASYTPREMDCMDCHNRPSHEFRPPQDFVDEAIAAGDIPQDLPEIKSVIMQLFTDTFQNTDTALMAIQNGIQNYYKENYPEIFSKNKKLIDQAIIGLQNKFKLNMFPEMKASWNVYPDHIGHIVYNGCFRCHSGTHVNKEGKTIPKDCNLCHVILQQGYPDSLQVVKSDSALGFQHPVDIDKMWKTSVCSECHRALY